MQSVLTSLSTLVMPVPINMLTFIRIRVIYVYCANSIGPGIAFLQHFCTA